MKGLISVIILVFRPIRAEVRHERADFRPAKASSRLEKADF